MAFKSKKFVPNISFYNKLWVKLHQFTDYDAVDKQRLSQEDEWRTVSSLNTLYTTVSHHILQNHMFSAAISK